MVLPEGEEDKASVSASHVSIGSLVCNQMFGNCAGGRGEQGLCERQLGDDGPGAQPRDASALWLLQTGIAALAAGPLRYATPTPLVRSVSHVACVHSFVPALHFVSVKAMLTFKTQVGFDAIVIVAAAAAAATPNYHACFAVGLYVHTDLGPALCMCSVALRVCTYAPNWQGKVLRWCLHRLCGTAVLKAPQGA